MKSFFTPGFLVGLVFSQTIIYSFYAQSDRVPAAANPASTINTTDPVGAIYQSALFQDDLLVQRGNELEKLAEEAKLKAQARPTNRNRGDNTADLFRPQWQQNRLANLHMNAMSLRSTRMSSINNAFLQMTMMINTYGRSLTQDQRDTYYKMLNDLRQRMALIANDSSLVADPNSATALLAGIPTAPAALPAALETPVVATAEPAKDNDDEDDNDIPKVVPQPRSATAPRAEPPVSPQIQPIAPVHDADQNENDEDGGNGEKANQDPDEDDSSPS